MSWGNAIDTEGQRAREFCLRDVCLEDGQFGEDVWSAVRSSVRIDDGSWHRVSVTKEYQDVTLYVNGRSVACGQVTNHVGGDEVGTEFFAARYQKNMRGAASYDWFWHGAIKNVVICDVALMAEDIFSTVVLTLSVEHTDMSTIRVTC